MNSQPDTDRPQFFSRRFLWLILPPVVLVVLILAGGAWLFWWPNRFDAPEKTVTVWRGMQFKSILDSLDAAGVVSNRTSFEQAARFLGITKSLKFGRYRFKSGMSNLAILRDLNEGISNYPIPVRVGEGERFRRVAGRLSRGLGIDSAEFVNLCQNKWFINSLGIEATTLEGYLLPDTYNFKWQTSEMEVIRVLVDAFKRFYTDSLRVRQAQLKLTLNKVLALASIVEAETSIDTELPTIAGVYLNRLRRRMPLQADPTIQYVLPDGPRRLRYADLRIKSPYNTYRNYGLPPGPINNPSRKSILAVLYPELHRYLYFVADGTGGHKFSKSYAEHQRAVRQWRRIRREMQSNATRIGG